MTQVDLREHELTQLSQQKLGWFERHRCQFGLHRYVEIPRVWWSFTPPLYECERCGKRWWAG